MRALSHPGLEQIAENARALVESEFTFEIGSGVVPENNNGIGKIVAEHTDKRNIYTLLLVALFIITTVAAVFADTPVLRQVLSIIFLTFLPGWLIIHILRLNSLSQTAKFVLSVGLSVAFVMFTGLLINTLYPLLGYNTPLDMPSVIVSFSVILLGMAVIAWFRNRGEFSLNLASLKLTTKEKAYLLVPALFPLISIVGMEIMNTTDDNAMLMALLFAIPGYVIFLAIRRSDVPERAYPPIILCTAVATVLLLALRSNYIIGADIHREFYLFQQTVANGRWQILLGSTLDACFSITLLPTIYQAFLNIDSQYLFKTLYPLLLSVSPLVVYLISRKYIGSCNAFLASFFLIAQSRFLDAAVGPRTNLGILFFALAVMVLFSDRLSAFNKRLLFIVFGAATIVSHYSTSYIFFFVLLFTWLGTAVVPGMLRKRKLSRAGRGESANGQPPAPANATNRDAPPLLKRALTITGVCLFFVLVFFWYSQVTGVPFDAGVRYISNSLISLQKLFILEARAEGVEAALGVGLAERGVPAIITFVFSWLTIALVALGVLTTLFRYRDSVAFSTERKSKPPSFLSQKLDTEFFFASLACSAILAAAIVVPFVLRGYGMTRIYLQMMVILSPFLVIGGIMLAKFLRVRWTYLLILAVLIPYFMCSTGTMYQILNVPESRVLNSAGHAYMMFYVHDTESYAAKWLSRYGEENSMIYTDRWRSVHRLVSQGGIHPRRGDDSSLTGDNPITGYIYLRYPNVVEGQLLGPERVPVDISEYAHQFDGKDRIYANGGSEVWK